MAKLPCPTPMSIHARRADGRLRRIPTKIAVAATAATVEYAYCRNGARQPSIGAARYTADSRTITSPNVAQAGTLIRTVLEPMAPSMLTFRPIGRRGDTL